MFMGYFGHIKTAVKCKLFNQYCCSYYGAPLLDLQSKSVGNIYISHGVRHSDIRGDLLKTEMLSSLLSDSLPLLINLKQIFIKFIHKALNHKSPVINSVAKLVNKNPWLHCSGSVSDKRISDMSDLPGLIKIRNGL